MPSALSTDLRSRVVQYSKDTGVGRILLSRIFGIGSATAYRWVKQEEATGSVEPKVPARLGREPKIKDDELDELRAIVAEKNDRTLQQLCDLWDERKHVKVDDATMCRALKRARLPLKKKPASRRNASGPTSRRRWSRSAMP
jgi:transposase